MASTNNPYGNYTVGQGPGNNQVNLGAMTGNLQNLLQSGNLGNNTTNPMSDIIANEGNSKLGYQNAIANSRMADLGLNSLESQLAQRETDWQHQQQQPGVTDFLGALLSGGSAVSGAVQSADLRGQMERLLAQNPNILKLANGDSSINNYLMQQYLNGG